MMMWIILSLIIGVIIGASLFKNILSSNSNYAYLRQAQDDQIAAKDQEIKQMDYRTQCLQDRIQKAYDGINTCLGFGRCPTDESEAIKIEGCRNCLWDVYNKILNGSSLYCSNYVK